MKSRVVVLLSLLKTRRGFFQNCLRTIIIKKLHRLFNHCLALWSKFDLLHFFNVCIPLIWLWIMSSNFWYSNLQSVHVLSAMSMCKGAWPRHWKHPRICDVASNEMLSSYYSSLFFCVLFFSLQLGPSAQHLRSKMSWKYLPQSLCLAHSEV